MVIEGGQLVMVDSFVEDETDLVLQSSAFELRLAGECTEERCRIETLSDGLQVLTLQERGLAHTEGVGFMPGSQVDIWLFSEPRYLGTLTVRADGTFEGTVDVGDIAPGGHTLQVAGLNEAGVQRAANLGVIVAPGAAELPASGSESGSLLVLGLALLGIGVIFTSRRRTGRANI
jgi:LPXTG-motif cell wall-anchored protein